MTERPEEAPRPENPILQSIEYLMDCYPEHCFSDAHETLRVMAIEDETGNWFMIKDFGEESRNRTYPESMDEQSMVERLETAVPAPLTPHVVREIVKHLTTDLMPVIRLSR